MSTHSAVTGLRSPRPLLAVVATMHGEGQPMPMWDWWSWMMWPVVLLTWILVIAAIIGGIHLLVRALRGDGAGGGRGSTQRGPDALAILEERYARGVIDSDEFEERRRALGR